MQQSNTYIIVFIFIMTLLLGGVLSFASVYLAPAQQRQIDLDTKRKILGAVMDVRDIGSTDELLALYDSRFSAVVVSYRGERVERNSEGELLVAERINVQKAHKLPLEERVLPVFIYKEDSASVYADAYVFPMFGAGLWDWISGFVALDRDLNTIKGVSFDHKSETPGLGARITSAQVQGRYEGKEVFSPQGELVSISMIKGEKGLPLDKHHVDGMSGATMTAKGVNKMLKEYLAYYEMYILNQKRSFSEEGKEAY